jgi:hypothetical protein
MMEDYLGGEVGYINKVPDLPHTSSPTIVSSSNNNNTENPSNNKFEMVSTY